MRKANTAKSKVCVLCKKSKSLDSFSSDRSRPDGLSARCRKCDSKKVAKYTKEVYYPKNKKKLSKYKRLDIVYSQIIRKRDMCCQRCGTTNNLHCSHIIPRTSLSVRWDSFNAIALCHRCHIYWWHKNPLEAVNWFNDKWPGRYEVLKKRSQKKFIFDRERILASLSAELEEHLDLWHNE